MAQLNNLQSPLLPTTQIFDVSDIKSMDVKSPEFKELIIRLVMDANEKSISINSKAIGNYSTLEQLSGKTYPPTSGQTPRNSYFKVVNIGTLPGTAPWLKQVAHNILFNSGYTLVGIDGAATDSTNLLYYPLPFVAVTGSNNISLWADATYVNINTNGTSRSTFTAIVKIEYLKD